MSGDAIVLCSLITSLPAGLVPIMSANSQLSSALLCLVLSWHLFHHKIYSSQQVLHSSIQIFSAGFTGAVENVLLAALHGCISVQFHTVVKSFRILHVAH